MPTRNLNVVDLSSTIGLNTQLVLIDDLTQRLALDGTLPVTALTGILTAKQGGTGSTSPVTSVAGRTGAVVLAEADVASLTTDLAAKLVKASNLSDLTNAGTARTNLGLGTLATQNGTFSGTSSGTNTGDQTSVSGNAGTATALQTVRTIAGASFDGTANILVGAKILMSRVVVSTAFTISNSTATTYVDLNAAFTATLTTLAGDQVHIVMQSIMRKSTGGSGSVVIDRGGTKLPAVGASSSVYTDLVGSFIPFNLEIIDTPGAGTFTYKPQVYTSDANVMNVGGGLAGQYIVELWR